MPLFWLIAGPNAIILVCVCVCVWGGCLNFCVSPPLPLGILHDWSAKKINGKSSLKPNWTKFECFLFFLL